MAGCTNCSCSLTATHYKQRTTLRMVFTINAVMFFVIVAAALYSGSTALLSDSFDNLGDAFTYALSLFAVGSTLLVKAKVAMVKGVLILMGAIIVTIQIVFRFIDPTVPLFEIMGIFSLVGLVANSVCLALLWRHRNEDINMNSVWECSRNDIASNLSVFIAAAAVWLTDSGWPDVIVAMGLVFLLTRSAIHVISSARAEMQTA